ncbi:MAG TPA: carboxypeptidase regulatory-like domain-containing protein [Pseudoalteromonas prydzensis]|uniref:Carboxypeptidase regulatory-like domain-containing protein n=1 Tax=Pseudoalteromonas prydzensis TaxID=182141 RepID=A0A7V1GDT4_9GAMM|nr:carboxypeptidase-like regulatory domain-containing protein [Pseudoalteromonas prydzensis]HEA15744.1 carboxypeptidase regulatory-like domain-containing protein [Pseudoalteromonas prydzensis]
MLISRQVVSSFILVGLSALFVVGCGGGGKKEDSTITPDVPVVIQPPTQSSGAIELGPVKGATVSIQALDGYTLATAITDDKGYFSVDADNLKSSIESYNADLKFVKVVSTGGIDTDPNDDGIIVESDQIEVKGNVSGIVPIATLYETSSYRINFISTALMTILEDITEISDEQLAYIIKRLGVPDINQDGKINIDDLTAYNIYEDSSLAETSLREGFLEYIHSGNKETQKLFIEELKYEVGFTRPLVTKNNEKYAVSLSKTHTENTIFYGIAIDQNNPSFEQYDGEELILNYNTAIFYQECSESYGCYKLQKIFFYEDTYYPEFDYDYVKDNYSELQTIIVDLDKSRANHNEVSENREQTELDIQALNDQISLLKAKVNSI